MSCVATRPAMALYMEAISAPPGWLEQVSHLLRAVAWPSVAFFFIWYFRTEIKALVVAIAVALGRLRSAKMPGIELTLVQVEQSLPLAEKEAKELQLPPGEVPLPRREHE
jgi:hypothetical protein